VVLGLLGVLHHVVRGVVDPTGQDLAVAVQVAQDGGRREGLEQGADREELVGAVPDRAFGADVVREDAQAGAVLLLQYAQAGGDAVGGRVGGGAGQQRGGAGGSGGEEGAAGGGGRG
jgi:hypothetical protein